MGAIASIVSLRTKSRSPPVGHHFSGWVPLANSKKARRNGAPEAVTAPAAAAWVSSAALSRGMNDSRDGRAIIAPRPRRKFRRVKLLYRSAAKLRWAEFGVFMECFVSGWERSLWHLQWD